MACPFSWLVITDGTINDAGIRNQIDLVSDSGFCVLEDGDWQPAITVPKGGGVWKDSQLADGRRPADFKAGNVVEAMSLTIMAQDQNALIRDTQELRRLLQKSRTYGTTDWQDEMVWIEAQSPGESNIRYAIIWDWSTPNDSNPYEQPFWQRVAGAGMNDFTLTLEREPYWRSVQPGTGTATAISAVEAYDGRNLGNVDSTGTRDPTTADEVYIAIKRNEANLTDVYVVDGGACGPNLMDAALPYSLMPAVPVATDFTLFGIDAAVGDSGPFSSLVFDIGTAGAGYTASWQYWNGAWVALTVQDNTNADGAGTGIPFDTTGVKSVHWDQPSDWTTVLQCGVTAFWVRLVILTTPGPLTIPTQQNRDIYSIIWPYVEIQSTAVLGDVAAILQTIIKNQSDKDFTNLPRAWANRVIFGLRSQSRGTAFTAYLNLADEQNPAGITVAVLGGGTAFANDMTAPSGRVITDTPGVVANIRASVSFSSAINAEYPGTYHGFLRYQVTGGVPANLTIQVFGVYAALAEWYRSPIHVPANSNAFQVFDLGRVDVPTTFNGHTPTTLAFTIDMSGDTTATIKLYDLILIPVDEWAIDTSDYTNDSILSRLGNRSSVTGAHHLDIDPITSPKRLVSLLKEVDDSYLINYLNVTGASPILQANADQRLWFFCTRFPNTGATEERAELTISNTVRLNHVAQYNSMRGNR